MASSLERAFEVLELVDRIPGGLTNHDISRRLRIPTSTCSYITTRLQRRGYLQRDEDSRRFTLGLSLVPLASGALRELPFRSVSERVLHGLASDTGLSVGIGVLDRWRVLIVDRVESTVLEESADGCDGRTYQRSISAGERTREARDTGAELPAHSTALGKVLLAHMPVEARAEFLNRCALIQFTPKTIVRTAAFTSELDTVRAQGYATADEELHLGLRALAVPITGELGAVFAAISVNGDVNAAAWGERSALLTKVEWAARMISTSAEMT